jgi:hypothetical protein
MTPLFLNLLESPGAQGMTGCAMPPHSKIHSIKRNDFIIMIGGIEDHGEQLS